MPGAQQHANQGKFVYVFLPSSGICLQVQYKQSLICAIRFYSAIVLRGSKQSHDQKEYHCFHGQMVKLKAQVEHRALTELKGACLTS